MGLFKRQGKRARGTEKPAARLLNATGFMPETVRVPWVKRYRSALHQTFR